MNVIILLKSKSFEYKIDEVLNIKKIEEENKEMRLSRKAYTIKMSQ